MSNTQKSSAMFVILIAGLFWSFGPLVVRNLDGAENIPWQYLLIRGLIIFLVLNLFLFLREGYKFINNYKKIGSSGLVGGLCLGIANITFILSLIHTTAAITMLLLAALPFMTAILAFLILGEKISRTTLIAIIISAIGILIMTLESIEKGTLFGLLSGLLSALGFAGFTVSLRWKKNTPKFTTVSIAGIVCALFAFFVIIFQNENLIISSKNSSLSALHGLLVCTGLILFSLKSKYLPAADLTLLSLTEVLGGIFWVWLPLLGINETPSFTTLIGGVIITFAIIFYGFNTRKYIFRY